VRSDEINIIVLEEFTRRRQAPIHDFEEFSLQYVQFHEPDTPNLGIMAVRAIGVTEGLARDGNRSYEEAVDCQRRYVE
jgi:hypothetical protein